MSKVDISFSVNWDTVKGVLLNEGVQVSSCEVFCGGSYMSIIRWNTVKDCQRMGFGSDLLRCTLRHCVDVDGKPERMYYEWDKVNQYVMDWLVRVFLLLFVVFHFPVKQGSRIYKTMEKQHQ